MRVSDRFIAWVMLPAILGVLTAYADGAPSESCRGPVAVAASADGKSLFVANADAEQVAVIDVERGDPVRTIAVPSEPTGLVLSPDGATLYVTCAAPRSTVQIIDVHSGQIRDAMPVGHTATGPAISGDGTQLYVCNRFDGDVSVIDTATLREQARVRVAREPIAAAITPDGRTVFVANHLPADPSDAKDVAAVVTAIDARTRETATIRLPNGSSGVRGLCMSPDGKHVYVTHTLSRYYVPTTQVERGWMNTNALTIIDAAAKKRFNTVLLDEVDRGAANPWGVATTADGRLICVTHAGTDEVSVIDAQALMAKLASRTAASTSTPTSTAGPAYEGGAGSKSQIAVSDDLTFLAGLRRRVASGGVGPRGVAVIGDRAYVCEHFTDTLGVVALHAQATTRPAHRIALGPPPVMTPERRGEMLFNSADLCFQHWQSCATCHPDGRADGLNWDLINDGLGNPKNVRSMVLAHETPPAMATGIRPTAQAAVRAGIQHIQFAVRPTADAEAIDAYLQTLKAVPSPYRVDGKLSEAASRGERLFRDPKVGCTACHPAPLYTDLKTYDVASRGAFDRRETFDTPTLIECWRTAPYLHDGRYTTMRELLEQGKHGATHGALSHLTSEQIADLVAFVLSL